MKKNKKGSSGIAVLGVIAIFVFGYVLMKGSLVSTLNDALSQLDTSGVTDLENPKARLTGVSAPVGFDVDDDDLSNIVIKYTDADLNSENATAVDLILSMQRNDNLRDLDSAGYIFSVNVEGLRGYDSWNSSVDDKVYLVTYDEDKQSYGVEIDGVSYKLLPRKIELKQGVISSVNVSIDLTSLTDHLNAIRDQYDSEEPITISVRNSVGETQARVTLVYTRTTA